MMLLLELHQCYFISTHLIAHMVICPKYQGRTGHPWAGMDNKALRQYGMKSYSCYAPSILQLLNFKLYNNTEVDYISVQFGRLQQSKHT